MNKDKINSKIEDLEAELQKLKQLANEPEQRTPEFGDVLLCGDTSWLVTDDGEWVAVEDRDPNVLGTNSGGGWGCYLGFKNLGKFNDVFVKIADVRDAVVSYHHQGSTVMSTEALRKLNIITD
jgi:hypothetical protein